jgi:hypothetical protein
MQNLDVVIDMGAATQEGSVEERLRKVLKKLQQLLECVFTAVTTAAEAEVVSEPVSALRIARTVLPDHPLELSENFIYIRQELARLYRFHNPMCPAPDPAYMRHTAGEALYFEGAPSGQALLTADQIRQRRNFRTAKKGALLSSTTVMPDEQLSLSGTFEHIRQELKSAYIKNNLPAEAPASKWLPDHSGSQDAAPQQVAPGQLPSQETSACASLNFTTRGIVATTWDGALLGGKLRLQDKHTHYSYTRIEDSCPTYLETPPAEGQERNAA